MEKWWLKMESTMVQEEPDSKAATHRWPLVAAPMAVTTKPMAVVAVPLNVVTVAMATDLVEVEQPSLAIATTN